ncbi:MAG: F0F1 ATP synthase subunit B [Myxococcota bacterium]
MSPLLLAAASFLDIRPGLIFWTIVTFIVVALVLRAKAWKPILDLVEEREKQISNAVESAKKERAEAERLLAEQKTAIAEARREAAELMRKNQAEMEKFRDELMAKSRKEAETLKQEATRAIADERAKAVAEVKAEAVNLAIQIAEKLLGEKLDDTKHRAMAEQFIAQLPAKDAGVRPVA